MSRAAVIQSKSFSQVISETVFKATERVNGFLKKFQSDDPEYVPFFQFGGADRNMPMTYLGNNKHLDFVECLTDDVHLSLLGLSDALALPLDNFDDPIQNWSKNSPNKNMKKSKDGVLPESEKKFASPTLLQVTENAESGHSFKDNEKNQDSIDVEEFVAFLNKLEGVKTKEVKALPSGCVKIKLEDFFTDYPGNKSLESREPVLVRA